MTDLIQFEEAGIRCEDVEDQRYFSIVDIIGVLTGSSDPKRYWSDMKRRDEADAKKEGGSGQLYANCVRLKMRSPDGKMRLTDCATAEGVLRIIQSIPSPKAEPFKQWLAKVGYERMQEMQDPELAIDRAKEMYRAMGMPEELIGVRLDMVQERQRLTDEWKKRGVKEGQQFAILTALIAERAIGLKPGDHKALKNLKKSENLRDHMTGMEMLLTQLGEAATTEITKARNAQGFAANQSTAKEGGNIAKEAREQIERATGKPIASGDSPLKEAQWRIQSTKPPTALE